MGLTTDQVLEIFADVHPQLRGNFKQIFEKIPEPEFESFAQGLGIQEPQYKFLLTFLAGNWNVLGTRSKGEIFADLGEVLKTYLSKNDVTSLRQLSLRTLNEYKGIRKETSSGEVGFRVIKITDVETCVRLTADSGWCVKDDDYASDYLTHGPLFLIIRDGKRLALLQPASSSYMDVYDNPLKPADLFTILASVQDLPEGQELLKGIGDRVEEEELGSHYIGMDTIHLLLKKSAVYPPALLRIVLSDSIRGMPNTDRLAIIKTLIDLGYNLNEGTATSPPVLFHFVHSGIPFMVEEALKLGLDPDTEYEGGFYSRTPLEHVVSTSADYADTYVNIAQLLLKHGANPNGGPHTTYPPLNIAVAENKLSFTQVLLEAGANPNSTIDQGYTPLHQQAVDPKLFRNVSVDIFMALIDAGADLEAKNAKGLTPLQLAKVSGTDWFVSMVERVQQPRVQEPIKAVV